MSTAPSPALFDPARILAALSEVLAHFAPTVPPVYLVTDAGEWTSGGDPLEGVGAPVAGNWRWDRDAGATEEARARFWLIVDSNAGPFAKAASFGEGAPSVGQTTLGSTATRAQIDWMRMAIVGAAEGTGRVCSHLILDFTGRLRPDAPAGAPMPDGTWQYHKNRARPAAYIIVRAGVEAGIADMPKGGGQ